MTAGVMQEPQKKMFAPHGGVAQALREGPGRGQDGPGLGGEGHGLDGDPSSLGACRGWERGMTDFMRFSWVIVEGAPSRPGVTLPGTGRGWLEFSMAADHLSGVNDHNIWGILTCLVCYLVVVR